MLIVMFEAGPSTICLIPCVFKDLGFDLMWVCLLPGEYAWILCDFEVRLLPPTSNQPLCLKRKYKWSSLARVQLRGVSINDKRMSP